MLLFRQAVSVNGQRGRPLAKLPLVWAPFARPHTHLARLCTLENPASQRSTPRGRHVHGWGKTDAGRRIPGPACAEVPRRLPFLWGKPARLALLRGPLLYRAVVFSLSFPVFWRRRGRVWGSVESLRPRRGRPRGKPSAARPPAGADDASVLPPRSNLNGSVPPALPRLPSVLR